MENRHVELIFNQTVNCVLKGAGMKLIWVVNHQHSVLTVFIGLETRMLINPCLFSRS